MNKRYRVWPYRQGSKSAKALAEELGGKVLKREGSKFVAKPSDVIINWGDPDYPLFVTENNKDLRKATNKLQFFKKMAENVTSSMIIPNFWENKLDIPLSAYPIVCRCVLAGHSGDGIVIAESPDDLVDAPLYVQYMKKKDEYRVHCASDQIISIQKKARKLEVSDDDVNWRVRNLAGGFIYKRDGIDPPANVTAAATTALGASGLDFGAVDVIWNEQSGKAYVLEINTAPGLEGTTVKDYAKYFSQPQEA